MFEYLRDFDDAVRSLPARQNEAITLYIHGYSVADIARSMGVAEGTVKAHLHHARRNMAAYLKGGAS